MNGVVNGLGSNRASADQDHYISLNRPTGFLGRAGGPRGDRQRSACDQGVGSCLHSVIGGGHIDHTVGDEDVAAFGVFVVVGLDSVAACSDVDVTSVDDDVVLATNAVVNCIDRDRARLDNEAVFARDAIVVVGIDDQSAGTRDREICR